MVILRMGLAVPDAVPLRQPDRVGGPWNPSTEVAKRREW
jgi:hypothetical protein